ncbi:MAG TPA: glutamate--tRNA ligase [Candidatus Krumholzibacteria bacterium]|nr:glutamate--tRNA ligase [Candidatus Krumholzibacteria bacterium]HPD72351.1 glutamate--tRNA ligase [Candidatus Krumholzibacteria bacterium]HRY40717.1 glutamate--tRNA ligase [Candidatus Krumholzibacteria bacterium]
MSENLVRVRFAPSPTGYLHVGGARTALFNWLYARNQQGVFVLRIEDTDRERSTAASLDAIIRGLEWLGLDWDEGPGKGGPCGPYAQSERLPVYRAALRELQDRDRVYRCFCSDEELERRMQAAKDEGRAWDGYDGHCRRLPAAQIAAYEAAGRPACWRLRTPPTGVTFWYDIVVGKREFQNEVITDRVVVKADGFPTYNFAVVVDDHTMGITHVLRGDDHVSNTPFQLMIYDALGWTPPKFGHMPMILGPDRKRLSKRHGAVSVEEFRDQGIIPQAMVNYLALLGWSIGASGDEVMTSEGLIKKFSLKKVNSSPAAFDYDKLEHINSQHLKRMDPDHRRALALPILAARGWSYDPAWQVPGASDQHTYVDRLLALLGGRFSSLRTLPDQLVFFFREDFPVDAEAWRQQVAGAAGRERLAALAEAMDRALPADRPAGAAAYEEVVRELAERSQLAAGELIHPARVALTGQGRSAGIFEVMEALGRPRVVGRLRRAAG